MTQHLRSAVKRRLFDLGWEVNRVRPEARGSSPRYSNFREQELIDQLLGRLTVPHRVCVDLGAGDGETMSNSLALLRAGWTGLAVEADPRAFAALAYRHARTPGIALARVRVTPDNVVGLLEAGGVPQDFGFLTLDIDSYDYFVLERVLQAFRPVLICAEINEKVPPPIKFAVTFDPSGSCDHAGHFYGQSLSILAELASGHGYRLGGLEYNNAFFVRSDAGPGPELSVEEAYERGYRGRPDRLERLPWNRELEPLLALPPEEAVEFVRRLFREHEGEFICRL